MSRRREVEEHRRKLGEIREIMNSMKSLAYMEVRKLSRFMDAQQAVVNNIHAVAEDFLGYHPAPKVAPGVGRGLYLLIGSERGFCGDFNEELLRYLDSMDGTASKEPLLVIVVGTKLHSLVQHDERLVAALDGPAVGEDVERVLTQIVDTLASLHAAQGAGPVHAVYHEGDRNEVVVASMLPPFETEAGASAGFANPPELNLPPDEFLGELTDHYLLAALQSMLYSSLMAENHRRLQHLDGAVRHLDDKTTDLSRRSNMLRQEEIIEEIEVILLSADSLAQPTEQLSEASRDSRSQPSSGRNTSETLSID